MNLTRESEQTAHIDRDRKRYERARGTAIGGWIAFAVLAATGTSLLVSGQDGDMFGFFSVLIALGVFALAAVSLAVAAVSSVSWFIRRPGA